MSTEDAGIFAIGGMDADLRLWDINDTKKPVWKAKQVKNDMLNMQVPVTISDFHFIPGGGTNTFVVGSQSGEVRISSITYP